jgi:hypothetical protein
MKRRLLFLALSLGLAGVIFWWWHARGTAPWRPALTSRELAMRMLGEHLARQFPGTNLLVIGNPFTQGSGQTAEIYAFEEAALHGLRQGFGRSELVQVAYPALRPEFAERPDSVFVDPKTTTPLSYLVTDDAFDLLIQAHPNCQVLVSLIGLPLNIRQSQGWRDPVKPRFALLLPDWRILGAPDAIRDAVRSGKIAAAVLNRPGATSEDSPLDKDDPRGEFERRFVLLTPENVDELWRTDPKLF